MCKDLRLIEGQGNSKRDEKNIEDLGELGREKRKYFCLYFYSYNIYIFKNLKNN